MSFFRMGRQPDTFALVVGFEGYVVSEGNAPGGGVLELHQARVEWDGDARGEDVLVKLRDAERGLPFDVTGDVVRVRLGVDEYAIDGHGEHVSQTNQGEHKRTDSGSILGTMFAGVGSAGNLASFLIGGDSSRDETNEATGSTTSRSGKPPVVPGGANNGAPKLPVTFNFSIEKKPRDAEIPSTHAPAILGLRSITRVRIHRVAGYRVARGVFHLPERRRDSCAPGFDAKRAAVAANNRP